MRRKHSRADTITVTSTDLTPILVAAGLPEPEREYRFHSERRWRFDYAWPWSQHPVALEVMGAVYRSGRHTRGQGYERDCEKLAEAVILGWRVIYATTGQVESGQAISWLERVLR